MIRSKSFAARLARLAVGLVVAAAVAGCDLMIAPSQSPRPAPSRAAPGPSAPDETDEVPTLRPEPSGSLDLIDAADALADLGSYRVAVVTSGLVPSMAADGLVSMRSTLVQGTDPAADFTIVGLDGLEAGRLDAVVIGDEAWLKSGSGRWTKSPGGAADFDAAFTALSPSDLVAGFDDISPVFRKIGGETKDGRPTTHFRADSLDPLAQEAGLTAGAVDVWLDRSGGELIAIDADGTWNVDGTATSIMLKIDVTHVDDSANKVRPPA
jgi:hypothetical protein